LRAQRDHYLPLKVIREHLDAISRGLEPPAAAGEPPRAPRGDPGLPENPQEVSAHEGDIRLSRSELIANSGLDESQLSQLEGYGLVEPTNGAGFYGAEALTVAVTVARMSVYGLEPRHLRAFKTAADREVALIDQVVSPLALQRDNDAKDRAAGISGELAELSLRLHTSLLRSALKTSS
ncbi:MAG: transcriptional regulator FtsR, partial [Nocardioidaceae bacterium]